MSIEVEPRRTDESLGDFLLRARAERGQKPTEPAYVFNLADTEWLKDLGSDLVSDAAQAVNDAVDSIGILEIYRRLSKNIFKKGHPYPGQVESIKVSCPIPGHLDTHPSAWINTDNQRWYCRPCERGGDRFHIASFHYGLATNGPEFWELKLRLVKDLRGVDYRSPLQDQLEAEREAIRNMTIEDARRSAISKVTIEDARHMLQGGMDE